MKNNIIREKRRLVFNFKRITPKIIRDLSNIIEQEIKSLSTNETIDHYIIYSVDATDNTSFESQSNEIFTENQIIESRVVRKVVMRFYTKDNSKNIEVQMVHLINDENSENFISVSGDEPNWVNGVLSRLSEIINNAENQSKFKDRFSGWIISAVFVLFNVEYFRLVHFEKTQYELLATLYVIGVPILSASAAFGLHAYIEKLWPSVELQTGPEYLQLATKKRNNMKWLMATIFFPILLAIIYDVVKSSL
ncbi:hypothetical protein FNW52_18550 [Flavobacterium sp. ZT3R18]|nr:MULTISPECIES: hypothetical protein [Flavobacterium]TRX31649.1 hypothetical protein FNW52_18550 [Flavobacterium sp. ZT3R18]